MSEVISPESSAKPEKASRKPRKPVLFSSCHVRFASATNIDVTRAAKANRDYVRRNFEAVCKVWPELAKSTKVNRDGNRYPVMIPAAAADMIVKRSVKGAKS